MAITRRVSPSIVNCELSFLEREPIDFARAEAEHAYYEATLAAMGVRILPLPADPRYPDGVFVEDPAVILDEVAVIARLGAESRRGEADSIAEAIAPYRTLIRLQAPATLEGGDVMCAERTLYVGRSQRTNADGVHQLGEALAPFGYRVKPVDVRGCLHLKSAVCYLGPAASGERAVLANRAWFDASALEDLKIIDVAPDEDWAANVLRIGDKLLMSSRFPRTRERLENAGYAVIALDNSELAKAESGLTCMSLLFDVK